MTNYTPRILYANMLKNSFFRKKIFIYEKIIIYINRKMVRPWYKLKSI